VGVALPLSFQRRIAVAAARPAPGVEHQDVHLPQRGERRVGQGFDAGRVHQIGLQRMRLAALVANGVHDALDALEVAAVHADDRAFPREEPGGRLAQAVARARDQRTSALDAQIQRVPPLDQVVS
jgi:hypothetical protein